MTYFTKTTLYFCKNLNYDDLEWHKAIWLENVSVFFTKNATDKAYPLI